MSDLCRLIWSAVFALFRSRAALHAEILFLRHQLNVLHRRSPKRVALSNIDRLVLAGLYCLAPQVLDALKILKPETVIRWHRAGFRAYWRWRSRPHGGRPGTPHETRELIRDMSITNPLWGAPRIHGELLKLGIDVGKPRSPNTWQSVGGLRPRAGGRFCIIMLTASRRWTCSWFRLSLSDCSMDC